MALLNYSTDVSVEKSVGEIQRVLAKVKVSAIMNEYDDAGVLIGVAFRVKTNYGLLSYRLPANIDAIQKLLKEDKRIDRIRYRTKEHAARVAWRILKDWVEAQVALIETSQVTVDQVFLPYAQNSQGKTVYELFSQGAMKSLGYEG